MLLMQALQGILNTMRQEKETNYLCLMPLARKLKRCCKCG